MITAFLFLSSFIQFYWLYRLLKKSDEYNARLTTLERREPEKRVHAPQDWNKPIEGFEPEIPTKVLPRSKEEKRARVKTEWEINSDFKIIG